MSSAPATLTVFIPLTVRKRNGRPRIMSPIGLAPECDDNGVDPHILRAIAKAWSWRRKLDSGQVTTIQDIATAEDVTPVYVGRVLKLAYLAPAVLERLLIERRAPLVSVKELGSTVDLPWTEQAAVVFEMDCQAEPSRSALLPSPVGSMGPLSVWRTGTWASNVAASAAPKQLSSSMSPLMRLGLAERIALIE